MQHTPEANKLQKMFRNFQSNLYTNRINVYLKQLSEKILQKKNSMTRWRCQNKRSI